MGLSVRSMMTLQALLQQLIALLPMACLGVEVIRGAQDSAVLAAAVLQVFFWMALVVLQCTVGDQHPMSGGECEEPLLPDVEPGRMSTQLFVGTVRVSTQIPCCIC